MPGRAHTGSHAVATGRGAIAPHLLVMMLAATAIGGAITAPRPALAQTAAPQSFAIPAQPLASALDAFARQTGWQVGYPSALAAGRTSPGVSGTLSPAAALDALLAGTGVDYTLSGPGTAALVAAPTAPAAAGTTVLPTVRVSGTIARDGVAQTVIGPEELARKNPQDLRDVFKEEPGIRVGGALPAAQKVYVNGLEETTLAVTVDGSRQNNKVFHHNGTNLIDPALLKVVRVDSGVAPADAGPGALAGSIAYETKDARDFLPADGYGGAVKATLNGNGPVLTTGATGYLRQGVMEALGHLTFARGSEYEAGNDETVDGTETALLSGLAKVAVQLDGGSRFQVSHERVRDDASRPFRANIGFISGRPAWEPRVRDYAIDRQNSVFTFTDGDPTPLWNPKVVVAYSRTEVTTDIFLRPVAPATTPGSYPGSGRSTSFNGKVENVFGLGFGTVTAGTDFYRDGASYEDETFSASERATNHGLYAQARLSPLERLRLSFGVRGDRQFFEGTTGEDWVNSGFSRNVSGEFDLLPEHLTAKAGYSHVWAGIPLAENFILNDAWRYGADGPEPVTSDNVTVGLEARYAGFTVEGRVFRTEIDDARSPRFAATAATIARDVKSKGFEVGAGYAWLDGFARVKYADIDVTIDGQPADSDTGTYLATPVGRILTVAAAHRVAPWSLTVGGDVEYAFEYDDVQPDQRPFDPYTVVNLFAEYVPPSVPNVSVRFDVRNLFDATYAERATYGQEFGTVTPLYQPGRTFLLTASAAF